MTTTYSTGDVHPRERVSYWREVATRAFVKHDFASRNGPSYRGDIRMGALDCLGIAAFTCDPCEVIRSTHDVVRCGRDEILLSLVIDGVARYSQYGREAINGRGSFLLIDSRSPFTVVYPERARAVCFRIPRDRLEARLGSLTGLTARAIAPDGAVAGLTSGFLSMLPSRLETLGAAAASKLSEQVLDLVALAVAAELDPVGGATLSSARATALLRLKASIETRLRDPDLRPATAASGAGISVRYANLLLSQEGSALERYILHRRLERCRQTLADPSQAHRMVGDVAFSWGFADLSHFARRFRAAYGLSPGEYRRRAREIPTEIPESAAAHALELAVYDPPSS